LISEFCPNVAGEEKIICIENALGLRYRREYVFPASYMTLSREESLKHDSEDQNIKVPFDKLIRKTSNKVLNNFFGYFENLQKSLRNILLEIDGFKAENNLLYSESFWVKLIQKIRHTIVENELWDFKKTLDMWHTPQELIEDKEFEFCEGIAAFANNSGGILIIGISDKIPRRIFEIDKLESRMHSIKTMLIRNLKRDADFVHLQAIQLIDDAGIKRNCLVVAIAQTEEVVGVTYKSGMVSYCKRVASGKVRLDLEIIRCSKENISRDNHNYILTLNSILHDAEPLSKPS
jgi:hypothetical protein